MKSYIDASSTLLAISLVTIPVVAIIIALTLWTDRTLDFWLTFFKGIPVDCPTWLSFLMVFMGPVNLMVNLFTELFRLAV